MSKTVLTDCRLFIGGFDASGWSNKIEIKRNVEAKETTNFRSGGAKERIGGLGSSELDVEGFWEAGDPSMPDDSLDAQMGLVGPWTVCPGDATVGALAYQVSALTADYTMLGQVGDVAPFKASAQSAWPRARGVILNAPGTARTATGTGTSVQNVAVPAGQYLYASLHVLSVAGTATPTITVRVESDDATGFASAVTQLTFAPMTAAGSQTLRVAGPITDSWYRVGYTITGTAPSFQFVVAMGIA